MSEHFYVLAFNVEHHQQNLLMEKFFRTVIMCEETTLTCGVASILVRGFVQLKTHHTTLHSRDYIYFM